ncbi:hypothetical protein RB595_008575 [Gaeumannomyces hyphopodioides]
MSAAPDWRACLTATARYDNIQKIQRLLDNKGNGPQQIDAFSAESKAYTRASSLAEYESACERPPGLEADQSANETEVRVSRSDEGDGDQVEGRDEATPGTRIGKYHDCHHVGSGVTAEVYRSAAIALKVIIETHNIAPHDPVREAKILKGLRKPCIPLLETFRDQEQRLVLVFPYMPLTLETLLERGGLTTTQVRSHFRDLFTALRDIHDEGIIHRDIKPSAVLLESPDGPAYLSDFGSSWHPHLSPATAIAPEPADAKILDIGTGPYRAPEVLFGDSAYSPSVDMWGAGALLAECCRHPPRPLFESRPAHEDGSQLGLILSIFKTIGSPTKESWPEATRFRTPPFDMYRAFEGRPWDEILQGVEPGFAKLIESLVKYDSSRATAEQALAFDCFAEVFCEDTKSVAN